MSVDTKGLLKKEVSKLDVLRFIKEEFDSKASMRDNGDYGFIDFEYESHRRNMLFIENNEDYKDEANWNEPLFQISLRTNENAMKIIEAIVSHFGGWYMMSDNNPSNLSFYPFNDAHTKVDPIENLLMNKLKDKHDWKTKMKIISFIKENLDFIKTL